MIEENEEIAEMRENISELRATLRKLGSENKQLLDSVNNAHGILESIGDLKARIVELEDAIKDANEPEVTVSFYEKLNRML